MITTLVTTVSPLPSTTPILTTLPSVLPASIFHDLYCNCDNQIYIYYRFSPKNYTLFSRQVYCCLISMQAASHSLLFSLTLLFPALFLSFSDCFIWLQYLCVFQFLILAVAVSLFCLLCSSSSAAIFCHSFLHQLVYWLSFISYLRKARKHIMVKWTASCLWCKLMCPEHRCDRRIPYSHGAWWLFWIQVLWHDGDEDEDEDASSYQLLQTELKASRSVFTLCYRKTKEHIKTLSSNT